MTTAFNSFKCERISETILSVVDEIDSRRRFTKSFRDRTHAALTKANEMVGDVDTELGHLETKALENYSEKKQKLGSSQYPSSD